MKLILLLFLLLLTSCGEVKKPPKALKGVLDLKNWDFKKDGPVKLSGEWKFHWNELKDPTLSNASEEGDLVTVPGPWTSKDRPKIERQGYGTYVLKVEGVFSKEALGLISPRIIVAYNLSIIPMDEKEKVKKIFYAGKVGTKKEEEVPEDYKSRMMSIGKTKGFFIVLQISNFNSGASGGVKVPLILGEESQIKKSFTFNQVKGAFIMGILFIISFYHLILYFHRKEDKAPYYFFLACFFMFIKELQVGSYFSWMGTESTILKYYLPTYIGFVAMVAAPFFFVMFLDRLFDRHFYYLKRFSFWYFITFLILYTVFFSQPEVYTKTSIRMLMNGWAGVIALWILVTLINLSIKEVDYSRGFLISYLVLFFGAFNDILVAQGILASSMIMQNCFIATILIQSSILSKKFSNAFKESEVLTDLLEDARRGLEKIVDFKTKELRKSLSETQGMLAHIKKGIFSIDKTGKVLEPVSLYSKVLFKKDIVGTNGLNLLFFHFKEGSTQKNNLVEAFGDIFGKSETHYLKLQGAFPTRVIQPDKDKEKGRVLAINTMPLLGPGSLVEKIMFIVEDVTDSDEEFNQYKEMGLEYKAFMEVLNLDRKDKIVSSLSTFTNNTISSLVKLMGPGSEEFSKKDVNTMISSLIKKFKTSDASRLKDLEKAIKNIQEESNVPKEGDMGLFFVWAVEKLSNLFLVLMRYVESLNTLHKNGLGPGVFYSLPKDFEVVVDQKKKDLDTMMKNILEYVFLVRDLDDLDEEKIANAPKKARLNNEFDQIIGKMLISSKLIYFLLKVYGKTEEEKYYLELSELLEQMPSKEKLTEASLINHLVEPYKRLPR